MFAMNLSVFAVDIPEPTSKFFINDYANVIDSATENYIYEKGKAYETNGGQQVVVLTVESIGSESVEEFSIETAREWGIGDKDEDNGVLILLVMESRDIRIEVGTGLEGVLNDGKCGRFIRRATDKLSSGDYSGGIQDIYDSVISELENPTEDGDEDEDDESIVALIPLIIFIILCMTWNKRRGGRGGFGGGYYRGGGGFGGSGDCGGGYSCGGSSGDGFG